MAVPFAAPSAHILDIAARAKIAAIAAAPTRKHHNPRTGAMSLMPSARARATHRLHDPWLRFAYLPSLLSSSSIVVLGQRGSLPRAPHVQAPPLACAECRSGAVGLAASARGQWAPKLADAAEPGAEGGQCEGCYSSTHVKGVVGGQSSKFKRGSAGGTANCFRPRWRPLRAPRGQGVCTGSSVLAHRRRLGCKGGCLLPPCSARHAALAPRNRWGRRE